MHFDFSRWNQSLTSFQCSCLSCQAGLSASIIKTPLHMHVRKLYQWQQCWIYIAFCLFSANSKCQANLCFNMSWCLKAIFSWNEKKNDLLECIRMQEEIFLADVSNLSLVELSATARCCEGCHYATASSWSQTIAYIITALTSVWWIHFSHECINYSIRSSAHVFEKVLAKVLKFKIAEKEFLWFRWKFFDMTFFSSRTLLFVFLQQFQQNKVLQLQLQTKTCTTFYYHTEQRENSSRRERKKGKLQSFFVLFQELMDVEKQKGDGLQAFVVRFCDGPE